MGSKNAIVGDDRPRVSYLIKLSAVARLMRVCGFVIRCSPQAGPLCSCPGRVVALGVAASVFLFAKLLWTIAKLSHFVFVLYVYFSRKMS